jgi:transposase
MDTSRQAVAEIASRASQTGSTAKRQRRTVEEKRRIVEETLVEGASVARVAPASGVNANQVFGWRNLYLAGRLGGSGAIKLLPVSVSENSPRLITPPSGERSSSMPLSGTIHIELRHAQVRVEGSADPVLLRVLLECLRA